MRIGVDVSSLASPCTGIGRYTYSLLIKMIPGGHDWILYSHKTISLEDFSFKNVKIRISKCPAKGSIYKVLWSQTALPLMANQDELDLFWSPAHRLPRYLSKYIAKVVTIHDLVWRHAPETMRPFTRLLDAKFMPEAIRIADQVVAVSKSTECDLIAEIPGAEGNINIIYGANSLGHIEFSKKFDKTDSGFFLFVGTIEPRKNLIRLLQAYSLLPPKVKTSMKLVIAGNNGWGKVNLLNKIKQLDLVDHVEVLFSIDDSTLATLYAHSQFLVMPSIYEGFGLPLIEAMSYGKPVIAANNSSMPEIVGNTGLLVDAFDIDSIAHGIKKMITNKKLREQFAKNAKKNAANYSWSQSAEKLIRVFEKAFELKKLN